MKLDSSIAAIVTGGASGLGAATARALAQKGVKVAIFDLNSALGNALAAEIDGIFCETNVTSDASMTAAFSRARDAHGQERVLVNCAGIGTVAKTVGRSKDGGIEEYSLEKFSRTLEVNLVGTFRCITKSAAGMLTLPPLEDGDRGVIVNTASVAAEDGQIGQAAYSASKAGVVGMTLPIARDLSSEHIRVNTILPGIFETPLLASVPEKARLSLYAAVPFPKRLGAPAEFAHLAIAMVENGYFNGESVRLDGAIRMAPR
jgi:NAD(P)-dependent dehydrogenase (short-subunit alcohol dehydrogenase family)